MKDLILHNEIRESDIGVPIIEITVINSIIHAIAVDIDPDDYLQNDAGMLNETSEDID